MKVYRGSLKKNSGGSPVLAHYGSKRAAAERVEGMYSNEHFGGGFLQDGRHVRNVGGAVVEQSLAEHLTEFADYASGCTVNEYELEFSSSLRLMDKWNDDPIGSGGPAIVPPDTVLSATQLAELQSLFEPFTGVIYPHHVHQVYSSTHIHGLMKEAKRNRLFQSEMQKRKRRLLRLKEYSKREMEHEAVWVYLTLGLRRWALGQGFDSFIYKNDREGAGEDSFVALKEGSASAPSAVLEFDRDRYLQTLTPEVMVQFLLRNRPPQPTGIICHAHWAGLDPVLFWRQAG